MAVTGLVGGGVEVSSAEDDFISGLLSVMTIEEKLGQLTQSPGIWSDTGPAMPAGSDEEIRAGLIGSFLNVYGAETTRRMQQIAVEESRLGIPLLFAHDVVHGFRTIFPVPLAEASSWNPELVRETARMAASEATAHGVHWTFAPMLDVTRDPRWGRVVEGSGEDPFLGAVLAAARVRGFQDGDLGRDDTLLACAKHFAAYGAVEAGRDYNPVDISVRSLFEQHLPPFEAAAAAGVASFMSAFNDIAGVPCHANAFLLRDLLRDQWGFPGIVVSDYTGIWELMDHGVASTRVEAGLLALKAGVDVDMVSGIYRELAGAVRSQKIAEAIVDEAVRRVLQAKFSLGLFADPYRYSDPNREKERTLTAENRALARKAACQSVVLLKNDGALLPLGRSLKKVAVIGPLADDRHSAIGSWAAAGRIEDVVTILDGIRQALPQAEVVHLRGCELDGADSGQISEAVELARSAEMVILVLGEHRDMSGEAKSRTSLSLPGGQLALAEAVRETGTPVVVVVTNGRPIDLTAIDARFPAILEAWYLGVEMGNAVADILFGDENPSGKLPMTFPRNVGQVPLYYNHRNSGRPPDPEDPFTSKYLDSPWTPLYPFGHGLSYTEFRYSGLRVGAEEIRPDESVSVEVEVANTGGREGTEVVQLYMQDVVGSTARPICELRGFQRVSLAPGETRTVSFQLGPRDLACYDPAMQSVVEPGLFRVYVGGSSNAELQASFTVVNPHE